MSGLAKRRGGRAQFSARNQYPRGRRCPWSLTEMREHHEQTMSPNGINSCTLCGSPLNRDFSISISILSTRKLFTHSRLRTRIDIRWTSSLNRSGKLGGVAACYVQEKLHNVLKVLGSRARLRDPAGRVALSGRPLIVSGRCRLRGLPAITPPFMGSGLSQTMK